MMIICFVILLYNLFFCFKNTVVIYVIKAKYKISKIYVIKTKYQILVIANLSLLLYAQLLYFITCFVFWDTVIYFGLTRCLRQVFSDAENIIKSFMVSRLIISLFQLRYSLKAPLLNKSVIKELKVLP